MLGEESTLVRSGRSPGVEVSESSVSFADAAAAGRALFSDSPDDRGSAVSSSPSFA